MSTRTLGILGGGQLGRMMAASCSLLNINVVILDVGKHAPAKQIVAPHSPHLSHIDGSFTDPAKIRELAAKVDVLTVEIEHVDVNVLDQIQESSSVEIHPSPYTIRIIQDKLVQKEHLQSAQVPVAEFLEVSDSNPESILAASEKLGLPLMLKCRTLAYDGRGNLVLHDASEIQKALETLGNRPLYAERWIPFEREVAVMVVRTVNGDVISYPVVETVHKDNICQLVFAPLRTTDPTLLSRARRVAEDAIRSLQGAGIFGVEMFLLKDGSILVNEIAPRPHNSGHYTIEACETSQFENHIRAILSLPLGSTDLKVFSAVMLNLIGNSNNTSELANFVDKAIAVPGASVHLYGKSESRKGRKMGHLTIVGTSDAQVNDRLRPLLHQLPIPMTSEEIKRYVPDSPATGSGFSHPRPLVGIIMGSDSDLPVMIPAARILDKFNVPYELTIVSAHRTPNRLVQYARSASSRGLKTIIAGAGGAAHLPGMVAAMTALPVIGVPVKGSLLDGVDSLYSIVQMPRGIPVATVAINNGTNAGLLAVRIISVAIPHLVQAVDAYLQGLETEVMGKVQSLAQIGWEKYEVKRS